MTELLKSISRRLLDEQNLAIWVLASAAAAYMGPFGTFLTIEPVERTFLWFAIVAWGLLLIAISMSVVEVFFPKASFKNQELTRLAIMPPLIIVTMYPVVRLYLAPQPMPITLSEAVLACYLLGAVVAFARFSVFVSGPTEAPAADASEDGAPRLMRRLPGDAEGPILRLSGRDHFVDIVTPNGRHSVRMRLSDAVSEMDGVDGLFTHRSHWVAREAIRDVERDGGKHYVVSTDEERIPVSRGKLSALEQAGLF